MATQDLGFNVFALDKASKTFIKMAASVERLSDKIKELDRQRANPEIDVDVQKAMAQARRAAKAFADGAEDEGRKRNRSFFLAMFTPSRPIVTALRTGIPAALGSPIGAAAIVLAGVFVASFAAAVIASGVFAAVGGGFTAIAALALKNNARIAESFAALGAKIKGQLSQAATVLIPAFETAMSVVSAMFGPFIREPLERIFEGLEPTIVPFAQSAVRTVGNILDSLATPQFLTGMQTVLASLSREMPRLGDQIGGFFVDLAKNADDIAEAFSNVVTVMGGLLDFAAGAVNKFTDLFNLMSDIASLEMKNLPGPQFSPDDQESARSTLETIKALNDLVLGFSPLEDPIGDKFMESTEKGAKAAGRASVSMEKLAASGKSATGQFEILAQRQKNLSSQLESTNAELDAGRDALDRLKEGLFGAANMTLNLRDAQRAYEEQLDTTRETLKENGATLDINTEKGRENQESIDGMAAAAHDQIQAMIEQGKSTEQVTEFTRQARKDFIKAAEAAGLEAGEARNLADQLGLVPSEVETKADLIDDASHKIKALEERIDALEREIGITATVRIQTIGEANFAFGGGPFAHDGGLITPTGIRRMHSGGMLGPDERVIIGQTGERILSRSQTRAFDAGVAMAGGGSASFQVVNHGVIGSQRETEDWLTRSLDNLRRKGRLPV